MTTKSLIHAALVANLSFWLITMLTLIISQVLTIIKIGKNPESDDQKTYRQIKYVFVISIFLLVLFW